jgi:hypothetical protein
MTDRLPTAREINLYDSLEERWAEQIFLGKDLGQAREIFAANFLHFQEALSCMGPVAFGYYVQAAISFLLSKDANFQSDAVHTFCHVIENRLAETDPRQQVVKVFPLLRDAIRSILDDFERFDSSIEIYGDLEGQYRVLLARLGG